MIQIRSNTFETNSSSAHTLVITKGNPEYYTPEEAYQELYWLDADGYWETSRDLYFGRSPFRVLSSFNDKLRYAYACAPSRKGRMKKSGYEGYWREYYKVTNVVKKFFGESRPFRGLDPSTRRTQHIGTDDRMLPKWLKDTGMSLIEFLTNKNVIVICDGDEYCIWTDMKKFGLINMDNIKLTIPEKEWWEEGFEENNDVDAAEEVLEDYKKEGED